MQEVYDRPLHSQPVDRAQISNLKPKLPASVTIFNIARTARPPELTCIGIPARDRSRGD
ncbi:hypothetical protein QUB60_24420 [Microcoleus sp. A2-C5]|uniref:hypothetical protein n=1 Tax=Microcoleaceae TaxID=1892252 RepID=UPI0022386BBA|nr:hypothetical protein [Lyngbya sp. CCAP 1446/10]MCW6048556.1 hypothetical protein [Lyngbya sp. CCAP 1446/10]